MPKVESTLPGQEGFEDLVRKFGAGRGLGSNQEKILWDGNQTNYDGWLNDIDRVNEPDREEDIEVLSSSPLDAVGNTGAQYIRFTGQGADGIEKTYLLPLNGTTPVRLSDYDPGVLFQVIYTAQAIGGGNNPVVLPSNQGSITIRSVESLRTMAIIQPNKGRTQMCIWRCPSNKWGRIKGFYIYPDSAKPAMFAIKIRPAGVTGWIVAGESDSSGDNYVPGPFPTEDYIPPGTDVIVTMTPEQNGSNASCQFWIDLEDVSMFDEGEHE